MGWYKRATIFTRAICIGSALGIGFLIPWLWPIGILGIFLTLYDIRFFSHSLKTAIAVTTISWFVKSTLVFAWFWAVYPITWIPVDLGMWELFLVAFYWLTSSLWLSGGGIILGTILYLLSGRSVWSLPIIWLIAELASAVSFSIATAGAGSSVSTAFSMGAVGYLVANHTVLSSLAQFGGAYLLSVTYAALAVCVWYMYVHVRRWGGAVAIVLVFSLSLTSSLSLSPNHDQHAVTTTKVATISTAFTDQFQPSSDLTHPNSLLPAVKAALSVGVDYVILPESSQLVNPNAPLGQQVSALRFLSGMTDGILIDSSSVRIGDLTALRGTVINLSGSTTLYQVDKQYLVPQGEFMPVLYAWIFRSIGLGEIVDRVATNITFRPGPLSSQATWPSEIPGILFCYESIDPLAVRRLLRDRDPVFIAHVLSHSWLHHPTVYWHQTDQMLRVQAIWNQIAIVSAGNYGPSKLYLPDGQIMLPTTVAVGDHWSVGIVEIPVRSAR